MAYIDREAGEQGGQPVELYHIRTGGTSFRICNVNLEVVYQGSTYTHVPIRRSELSDSYDVEDGKMDVWMSKSSEVGALFLTSAPTELPFITVVRGHLTEGTNTVALEDSVVMFNGKIATPSFGESEVKLGCTSLALGLQSAGLRRKFSGGCAHFLYKGACGVDKASYSVAATITGIAGEVLSLDITPQDVGYYNGGMVTYQGQYRMITTYQGGQNVVLLAPLLDAQIGDVLEIAAGCDHTKETCRDRFDNLDRFGGWSFVPTINYFVSGL